VTSAGSVLRWAAQGRVQGDDMLVAAAPVDGLRAVTVAAAGVFVESELIPFPGAELRQLPARKKGK